VINREAIALDVLLELSEIQRRAERAMAARREATQLGEAFRESEDHRCTSHHRLLTRR